MFCGQAANYAITSPMPFSGWRGICVSKGRITLQLGFIRAVFLFAAATFAAHSAFSQSWTELSPSGTPPAARGGVTGVYDPTSNRMIVFGGRDASGENRNDVWVLTHANGEGASQWIRLIANGVAGSPPARSGHSAVYDSVNNRMIIFGGCQGSCAPLTDEVWVLSNANGLGGTPVWAELFPQVPQGVAPSARTNAAAVYEPSQNLLLIFGGEDGSGNPAPPFRTFGPLPTPMD